ncbi:hypothetical protein HDK90DRAFT_317489 [Phyllosticta capitalensis]|uniref:Uncharacterized protein n=1 Tax=Phyllosticta capitalensis TaxID=121624 RepID=A0ABR1YHG0_9PEZI
MRARTLPAAAGLGSALGLGLDVRRGVRLVASNGANTGGIGGQNSGVGLGNDRLLGLLAHSGRQAGVDARLDLGRGQQLGVGCRDDLGLGGRLGERDGRRVRLLHRHGRRVGDRDDRGHAVDARLGDDLRDRLGFGHDDARLSRRVDGLDVVCARRLGRWVRLRRRRVAGRGLGFGLAGGSCNQGAGESQLSKWRGLVETCVEAKRATRASFMEEIILAS